MRYLNLILFVLLCVQTKNIQNETIELKENSLNQTINDEGHGSEEQNMEETNRRELDTEVKLCGQCEHDCSCNGGNVSFGNLLFPTIVLALHLT